MANDLTISQKDFDFMKNEIHYLQDKISQILSGLLVIVNSENDLYTRDNFMECQIIAHRLINSCNDSNK